jgi:hypothetical protein
MRTIAERVQLKKSLVLNLKDRLQGELIVGKPQVVK